jgi:hypothetical protein
MEGLSTAIALVLVPVFAIGIRWLGRSALTKIKNPKIKRLLSKKLWEENAP